MLLRPTTLAALVATTAFAVGAGLTAATPTVTAKPEKPSTSATRTLTTYALDQGMVMAALGNALAKDDMRRYVALGAMEKRLRPLMQMERFSAGEVR